MIQQIAEQWLILQECIGGGGQAALFPFTSVNTIKTTGLILNTKNFPMMPIKNLLSGCMWDCAFYFPKIK